MNKNIEIDYILFHMLLDFLLFSFITTVLYKLDIRSMLIFTKKKRRSKIRNVEGFQLALFSELY